MKSQEKNSEVTSKLSGSVCAELILQSLESGNSSTSGEVLRTTIYLSLGDSYRIHGSHEIGIELPKMAILFTSLPEQELKLADTHVALVATLQSIWARLTRKGTIMQRDLFGLMEDTGATSIEIAFLLERLKSFHLEVVERERSLDLSVQDGHLVPKATVSTVFLSSHETPDTFMKHLRSIEI